MRNFFSLGDWDRRANSHPFGYMQNEKPKKCIKSTSLWLIIFKQYLIIKNTINITIPV